MSWATEDREYWLKESQKRDAKYESVMSVLIPIVLVLGGIGFVCLIALRVLGVI